MLLPRGVQRAACPAGSTAPILDGTQQAEVEWQAAAGRRCEAVNQTVRGAALAACFNEARNTAGAANAVTVVEAKQALPQWSPGRNEKGREFSRVVQVNSKAREYSEMKGAMYGVSEPSRKQSSEGTRP